MMKTESNKHSYEKALHSVSKFLLLAFLILVLSCKKDSEPDIADNIDGYYMRFDYDGREYFFSKNNTHFQGHADLYNGEKFSPDYTGNVYQTQIRAYPPISYPTTIISIRSPEPIRQTSYILDTTKIFVGIVIELQRDNFQRPQRYASRTNARASLTKIGVNTVSGTFSGTIYSSEKQVEITNGRFYLPRRN